MTKSKHLNKCLICTRGQRNGLWFVFVGLFICGLMTGLGTGPKVVEKYKHSQSDFSEVQCDKLRNDISYNNYASAEILSQMYQIYNENCVGREFSRPEVVQPENDKPLKTCEQIELYLQDRLPSADGNPYRHIERAKIFAQLSERGCPENSEKYVAAAQQDLEIARALLDDNLYGDEVIEVVETYKRLDMQAAAEEIFEMAKKLTDPAIDFILEVEKIINEK